MSFSAYSLTPSANVSINGISIAEGCAAGNINNALRQLAADGKELYGLLPDLSTYMGKGGGVFSGDITRAGQGAYLHNLDPANASGRVFIQAIGGTAPSMSDGDWLLEY